MLQIEYLLACARARRLEVLAELLDKHGAPAESVRATALQAESEAAFARELRGRILGAQGVGPWSAPSDPADSLGSGGRSDWPSVARPGSFRFSHQTDEAERRADAAAAVVYQELV